MQYYCSTLLKSYMNTFCHLLYLNYAIVLLDTRMLKNHNCKHLWWKKIHRGLWPLSIFFFITCGCNLDFPTSCGCQATPYLQILIFSRTVFYVCVIFSTDKRLISSFSTTFRKIQWMNPKVKCLHYFCKENSDSECNVQISTLLQ